MKIAEICAMPTTIGRESQMPAHESVMRSYHVVQKLRDWIAAGVPHVIMLELLEEMTAHQEPDV